MANYSRIAAMSVYPRLKNSEDVGEAYCVNVEFNEYKSERQTLVLLHGYMGSSEDYEPAFEKLHDRYNLIAIDLRGHGKSDAPGTKDVSWFMEDLAEDIMQVVNLIIPEVKFSIIASSMATGIALELARIYPEVIDRLFLLSPTTKFIIPAWVKLILGIGKISPNKLVGSVIEGVASVIGKFGNEQEKELWQEGFGRFQQIGLDIHKKIFEETLATWEIDPQGVHQPVFIIGGLKDKIVPHADTLELVDLLPNASMLTLNDVEHHLIKWKKDLIFDLVEQWMDNCDAILKTTHYTDEDVYELSGQLYLDTERTPSTVPKVTT